MLKRRTNSAEEDKEDGVLWSSFPCFLGLLGSYESWGDSALTEPALGISRSLEDSSLLESFPRSAFTPLCPQKLVSGGGGWHSHLHLLSGHGWVAASVSPSVR